MMKRIFLAMMMACALALGGCMAGDKAPAATATPEPTAAPTEAPMDTPEEGLGMMADEKLNATVEQIYEKQPVELMMAPVTAVDLSNTDWLSYNTGLSAELADKVDAGVLSESMTGSQAYSLVVLRLKDAADGETVARAMMENIDPAKWVCVMADQQMVSVYGDTVVYCMADSNLIDPALVMAAANEVLGTPDYSDTVVIEY